MSKLITIMLMHLGEGGTYMAQFDSQEMCGRALLEFSAISRDLEEEYGGEAWAQKNRPEERFVWCCKYVSAPRLAEFATANLPLYPGEKLLTVAVAAPNVLSAVVITKPKFCPAGTSILNVSNLVNSI